MQAVVPAAGEGTRLRPLTADMPKGLVSIGGQPLLTYCFKTLADLDLTEIIVIIGYRGDAISDYYGERYRDIPLTYVRQAEPTGLATALLAAEELVESDFVVHHGDNIFNANTREVVARHQSLAPAATLLVDEVSRQEARQTGVCRINETGELTGLVEKPENPPSRLTLTGFFVFSPRIFHACHLVTPSARGEYELTDAIDLLLAAGLPIETVPLSGWRQNINTPSDRETAEEYFV